MRSIELLAPAKTADIGIEAIRHGADAVYIGAPSFGARAAAGNSVENIARLVEWAHLFKAKVYVTVNTIIFDKELAEVERLIWQLYDAHVDALIIQDLRILSLNLPPIPLHASTQMDNRTVEQVQRLERLGFPQVVLARELTINEIRAIHEACPDTLLEVFVHGALCVSFSGRCNASEALFRRSANRGECAQVCRMAFDLIADGRTVVKGKHLLSLKDNCQIGRLEELLMAGASSLKIEGRLKDAEYVKNVTAAYSQALDAVIAKHPMDFCRASSGHVRLSFTPDVAKSFNRGFVADTSKPDANIDTPKAMGEPVTRHTTLHNGDGLCYIDKGKLVGFRISNADHFRPLRGVKYYRNQDAEWSKTLSKPSAERKIFVDIDLYEDHIEMTDEDGITASVAIAEAFELAHTHQSINIERQLSKLGGTIFEAKDINIHLKKNYFIPSSLLTRWRQTLTAQLAAERQKFYPQPVQHHTSIQRCTPVIIETEQPFELTHNLSLPVTIETEQPFELTRDLSTPVTIETEQPFELTHDLSTPLMTSRYCIRRQLGVCLKDNRTLPANRWKDLSLRMSNGTTFRIVCDCANCQMMLYLQTSSLT